jgi:signal transduction histidine kinase
METKQREEGVEPGVPVSAIRELLHDLGGPLVAAQGFLSLLERAPPGPSAQRYAAALRESIESMKKLLERTRAAYEKSDPQ